MMIWAMRLLCCVVWWSVASSTSAAEREVHCPKSWPEGSQNTGINFVVYDDDQVNIPGYPIISGDQETYEAGSEQSDLVCQYKNGINIILPLFKEGGMQCSYSYYAPKHKPKKPRPDLELKYLDAMCKIPDDYQGDLSFSKVARITDQDDLQGIRLGERKETVRARLGEQYKEVLEDAAGHLTTQTSEGRRLIVIFDQNNVVRLVRLTAQDPQDQIVIEIKRRFGPPFYIHDYDDGITNHIDEYHGNLAWQNDHGVTMVVRWENPSIEHSQQTAILSHQPLHPSRNPLR